MSLDKLTDAEFERRWKNVRDHNRANIQASEFNIKIKYDEQPGSYTYINNMMWMTKDGETILVEDMKRSHIQHAMNWCIRKQNNGGNGKDGYLYQEWISAFFAKLLDPSLGE